MASIKLKGDTSGEITISAPAVAGTTTLELPATSSTLATQNALGVRNLIINGDMQVDQRGNLPLTNNTSESDVWLVDRFKSRMFYATGAVDMSYEKRTDGLVKLTSNFNANMASGDNNWFRIMTTLEQREANYVAGKTITVSFDFESNISGDFSVGITMGNGAGAGTNKDYATLFSYTTGAVQRITKTITIPDSVPQNGGLNDAGLILYLAGVADTTYGQYIITPDTWGSTNGWVATGTTNWIQSGNWIALGNIQLEVGDTATPFEHRPYDMELARCQRYYWRWSDLQTIADAAAYSTTAIYGHLPFGVTMRTSPTVSVSDTSHITLWMSGNQVPTAVAFAQNTDHSVRIQLTVSTARTQGDAGWITINTGADHYIHADAEL